MEGIECQHTEFADDSTVWVSGDNLSKSMMADVLNKDIEMIAGSWCKKWNMSIAADKTEIMVVKPSKDAVECKEDIFLQGQILKKVKVKKVLGVYMDNELSFKDHIDNKVKSGFKALSSIKHFGNDKFGCNQDIFLQLYRSLVLPTMEYGISPIATATEYASKEFSKVQRQALITATGCEAFSGSAQMEVLTNTIPMEFHIKSSKRTSAHGE